MLTYFAIIRKLELSFVLCYPKLQPNQTTARICSVCDAWSLLSHSQKSNYKWLHWILNLEHLMTLSPYFILFPFISVIYLTSCYGICSLGADTFHLCIPVKTVKSANVLSGIHFWFTFVNAQHRHSVAATLWDMNLWACLEAQLPKVRVAPTEITSWGED